MKNYRETQNIESFPPTPPPVDEPESNDRFRSDGRRCLPEGWRQLPTGLRGARLFRIVPLEGGDAHWQAEMTLNGEVQHRRCVSELHARWWLAVLSEPRFTPSIFDGEELNAPLRASFARGE